MPVKLLLADKSITIQKVVEMLFSGKEYEVTCVSDGESALGEASRVHPNVILVDVDLPRIDGYSFAARLKEAQSLAGVPVILMLSRDDQYDAGKGKKAGIIDSIAKPFESQELIAKVKKALTATATMAAPSPKPAAVSQPPAAKPPSPPAQQTRPGPAAVTPQAAVKPAEKPAVQTAAKPSALTEIFDILEEAPAGPESDSIRPFTPQQAGRAEPVEEEVFEVEPEIEVEPEAETPSLPEARSVPTRTFTPEPQAVEWKPPVEAEQAEREPEVTPAEDEFSAERLFGAEPAAKAAVVEQEPRIGPSAHPGPVEHLASGGTFDFSEPLPTEAEGALPLGERAVEEMREGLGLGEGLRMEEPFKPSGTASEIVSFESLDVASRVSHEDYAPTEIVRDEPSPERGPSVLEPPADLSAAVPAASAPAAGAQAGTEQVTDEMLKVVVTAAVEKMAKELIERVAWEVIPDLAEQMIRAEIDRLKSGT